MDVHNSQTRCMQHRGHREQLPPPSSPVLLPGLIDSEEKAEPEDIFASALTWIDPLHATNQHGEPGTAIRYNVRNGRPFLLQLSEPAVTAERWLFAHYVWNAGVLLAECLGSGWWWTRLATSARTRTTDWNVCEKTLIELGAGTGIAGLAAAQAGARSMVITDYPSPNILNTLRKNVHTNIPNSQDVQVQGHEWGCFTDEFATERRSTFDLVLAADTLWSDGTHGALVDSMAWFLKHTAKARVWLTAGFHTGRPKVKAFLDEALPKANLIVLEAWEVDVAGNEHDWDRLRQEGPGEAARWCVVAIIGWDPAMIETFKHAFL